MSLCLQDTVAQATALAQNPPLLNGINFSEWVVGAGELDSADLGVSKLHTQWQGSTLTDNRQISD